MKKLWIIGIGLIIFLLVATVITVGVMYHRASPEQNQRAWTQALDEAEKTLGVKFDAKTVAANCIPLWDAAKANKRVACEPATGRSSEHTLPANWEFYLPRDWRKQGSFEFQVRDGALDIHSSEYALIIDEKARRKPGAMLIRVRCSGRGRLAPFLRAYDVLDEKEFHLWPERIFSWFPRDYYFFFHCDNALNTINAGLDVRGNVRVHSVELMPLAVPKIDQKSHLFGTVMSVSPFPEPAKSAYPNCLYAMKIKVHEIRSGASTPRYFVLLAEAFKDRKLAATGSIKVGDRIQATVMPFLQADEQLRSTQQADTLDLFDAERYIACAVQTIPEFRNLLSPVPLLADTEYNSPYEIPVNGPVKTEAQAKQNALIAADLKIVSGRIKALEANKEQVNRAFNQAWSKEQKKHTLLPDGKTVWMRKDKSFFSLPSQWELVRSFSLAHNIDALKELQGYLNRHGVQLIIAVIPGMPDIAARTALPEFAKYIDYSSGKAVQTLLENGIEAVYCADDIVAAMPKHEYMYYYPDDPHPLGGIHEVITSLLGKRLEDRFPEALKPRVNPKDFSWGPAKARDGLHRPKVGDVGRGKHGEAVGIQQILYRGKPFDPNPINSSILVIGNSFIQTPFPEARSFSAYLAKRLNYLPYEFCIPAHGPAHAILLELYRNPEYFLKGRKVCILSIPDGHLAEFHFLNLKKLDDELRFYAENTQVATLNLPKTPAVVLRGSDASLQSQWLQVTGDQSMQLFLPDAGKFYSMPTIAVPEKYRDGSYCISYDFILCVKGSTTLRLNGKEHRLPVPHGLTPYKLLLPLEKGCRELKMELSTYWPGGAIALRAATIYAKADKP